jgi:hypothetical protein
MGVMDWVKKGVGKLGKALSDQVSQAWNNANAGKERLGQAKAGLKPKKWQEIKGRTIEERLKNEVIQRRNPFDTLFYLTEVFYGELFSYRSGSKLGVVYAKYQEGDLWSLQIDSDGQGPMHFRLTDEGGVLIENVSFARGTKSFIISGYGDSFLPFGFGHTPQQVSLQLKVLSGGLLARGYALDQLLEDSSLSVLSEALILIKKKAVGEYSGDIVVPFWYLTHDGVAYLFTPMNWNRAKIPNYPYFEYFGVQGLVLYRKQLAKQS